MIIEQLQQRWHYLIHRQRGSLQYNVPFWREIQRAYTAQNRHYHNLYHLADLFAQADYFKDQIKDFDTLQFSIWYHDVIYNTLKKDNEEKSALYAKYRLEAINFPRERLIRCYEQINATKSHLLCTNDNGDTAYLLDFDLSILGRNWNTYFHYTQQIRKEYAIFPTFLYKRGRRKVLNNFLKTDRLFYTQFYFNHFEAQARDNIRRELELLDS